MYLHTTTPSTYKEGSNDSVHAFFVFPGCAYILLKPGATESLGSRCLQSLGHHRLVDRSPRFSLSFHPSPLFLPRFPLLASSPLIAVKGILAYRTLPLTRAENKIFHNACMLTAAVLVSLGLYAVFQVRSRRSTTISFSM